MLKKNKVTSIIGDMNYCTLDNENSMANRYALNIKYLVR